MHSTERQWNGHKSEHYLENTMIAMNTEPKGWRGTNAKLVKLDKPQRVRSGKRRYQYSYGIIVKILGVVYCFPANRDGSTRMEGTRALPPKRM